MKIEAKLIYLALYIQIHGLNELIGMRYKSLGDTFLVIGDELQDFDGDEYLLNSVCENFLEIRGWENGEAVMEPDRHGDVSRWTEGKIRKIKINNLL